MPSDRRRSLFASLPDLSRRAGPEFSVNRGGSDCETRPLRNRAASRVKYGYRRLHVLLEREGWQVNHKLVYRLYLEEGLPMRIKTPKRHKSCRARVERPKADRPNESWSMDFMSEQLFDGRKFRLLTPRFSVTR